MRRLLKRAPGTISRELARHSNGKSGYVASLAGVLVNRLNKLWARYNAID
ncbi:MAG: hypothetical protein RQ714_03725 [Nitrosomonas sp.]|nr:hypothetical protein [Nitrosomonas sp.]